LAGEEYERELPTHRQYDLTVNPTVMPYSTRRFLEWINLVLGVYCAGVGLGSWLASPLRAGNGWSELVLASGFYSLPFIFLTSFLLLFVNVRRAFFGFGIAVLACVAFWQVLIEVR
jgi:hypothetical protein